MLLLVQNDAFPWNRTGHYFRGFCGIRGSLGKE